MPDLYRRIELKTGDLDYEQWQEMSLYLRSALETVISLREATPGVPADGPYPATIGEVADEIVDFVNELDRTCAPGLINAMHDRLTEAA
jgi:hypothetical protein